jgi:hypothetical protein
MLINNWDLQLLNGFIMQTWKVLSLVCTKFTTFVTMVNTVNWGKQQ